MGRFKCEEDSEVRSFYLDNYFFIFLKKRFIALPILNNFGQLITIIKLILNNKTVKTIQ